MIVYKYTQYELQESIRRFLHWLPTRHSVHCNKYNHNWGFVLWIFFFSTLWTDITFRGSDGIDYAFTVKNKNLPVYNGQSVKLILLDNMVIGFIDISTGFYYYLSNNLKETIQGPTSRGCSHCMFCSRYFYHWKQYPVICPAHFIALPVFVVH